MKTLKVEVITPSKKAYNGEVHSITVPGSKGNFQILYNHAPILSSLEIGKIKIVEKEGAEAQFYAISGGTVEVLNNKVLILAESFEAKSEIDIERAEKSKRRAEERISSKKKEIDLTRAEISLKRAINRLKIAKR